MYAIINLLHNIIFLINLALLAYIVLDVLLHFDIVNRRNPLITRIYDALRRLLEPLLTPIRRLLGKLLPQSGIDLSPIVLILLLKFMADLLPVPIPDPGSSIHRTPIVEQEAND